MRSVRTRMGAARAPGDGGREETAGAGRGAEGLPEVQEPVLEQSAERGEVGLVADRAECPLRATVTNTVPLDRL